jgi:hypothetical protein
VGRKIANRCHLLYFEMKRKSSYPLSSSSSTEHKINNSNGKPSKISSSSKKGGARASKSTSSSSLQDLTLEPFYEEEIFNTACCICNGTEDEDMIILCDGSGCKKETHMYCLTPPLYEVPSGEWYCDTCDTKGTTKYLEKYFENHQKLLDMIVKPFLIDGDSAKSEYSSIADNKVTDSSNIESKFDRETTPTSMPGAGQASHNSLCQNFPSSSAKVNHPFYNTINELYSLYLNTIKQNFIDGNDEFAFHFDHSPSVISISDYSSSSPRDVNEKTSSTEESSRSWEGESCLPEAELILTDEIAISLVGNKVKLFNYIDQRYHIGRIIAVNRHSCLGLWQHLIQFKR